MYSQCQGTTKQNAQCRRDWELDAHGFCELHRSQNPSSRGQGARCRGLRKDGKPCSITWDLDKNAYCMHHKDQYEPRDSAGTARAAPPPSVSSPRLSVVAASASCAVGLQCRGTTKKGVRCTITWGLDDHSVLCKHHRGKPVQCHGECVDGSRCDAVIEIDRFGFCVMHGTEDGGAGSPPPHAGSLSSPPPLRRPSEDDDHVDTDTEASGGSPREGGDEASVAEACWVALLFDVSSKRAKMGLARPAKVIQWEIRDPSGSVVEEGWSTPGVVHLLTTVRPDAKEQLTLTATVDGNTNKRTEPATLAELQSTGAAKLPDGVTLRVLKVVAGA